MKKARGAALIIVIFAMMLFAALGWTLANLQTGDFEANLRNLDSEQALSLAEAGSQWALNQFSQDSGWRTDAASPDSDCDDANDWQLHTLGPGQYRVCCRNPVSGAEEGDAVIESQGYVPQYATNYRAMRIIKLVVQAGSLASAVRTPPADAADSSVGLFNWWPARGGGHSVQIEGDIYVGHYRGDNDTSDDEPGEDYDRPPAPILPSDSASPSDDLRNFSGGYHSIKMDWFYNNAAQFWPSPCNRDIEATADIEASGSRLRVSQSNFFINADKHEVIVRRTDVAQADRWNANNWAVITEVSNAGGISRAEVSPSVGGWPNNVPIKLVKRFYQTLNPPQQGMWYIGSQEGCNGPAAETFIDVRTNKPKQGSGQDGVTLSNTYIISEGDIVIQGDNQIEIRFTGGTPRYPTLATKSGNIISTDALSGTESQRIQKRQIAGLIYSEAGEVTLNYLQPPQTGAQADRGNLVYGRRITLDGQIDIHYKPNLVTYDNGSFIFAPGVLSWQEQ